MKLSQAKKGQVVKINNIPNEEVRAQAIRFGINEGSIVVCQEIIPAGPVVLRKNRQEIAVGRSLAERITIQAVS